MSSLVLDEAGGSDDVVEQLVESGAAEVLVGEGLLEHLGEDGDLVEATLSDGHEEHVAAGTSEERSIGDPVLRERRLNRRVPDVDEVSPLGVTAISSNEVEQVVLEVVDVIVKVGRPGGVVVAVGADHSGHGEDRGNENDEFQFLK